MYFLAPVFSRKIEARPVNRHSSADLACMTHLSKQIVNLYVADSKTTNDFETLSELFLKSVERHPKPNTFLYKCGGRYQGLSSQEVLEQVAALGSALARRSIDPGDRVALLAENRVEWALTDYAVLGIGGVLVPIYPTLLEPDLEFILRDSGSKGIVVSTDSQLRKILNIRSQLPELRFVFAMDRQAADPGCGTRSAQRAAGEAAEWWQKVVSDEGERSPQYVEAFRAKALAVKPQQTASILYTSGTTGALKGVVLTHANIASNVKACVPLYPLSPGDVGMSILPLCHIFERMFDYVYFWNGATIAYPENMDALPQNLLEVRPMGMAVVPRILEKVFEKVMETSRRASRSKRRLFEWALEVGLQYFRHTREHRTPPLGLRLQHAITDTLVGRKIRAALGGRVRVMFCGSAPLSQKLAEFYFAVGLPVYEGYGLTETSPVISTNHPASFKLGTVGRPIAGVEVKLLDELVTDEEGGVGREILVRGPNVTPGYYHLEKENEDAFKGGWFHTGDLGSIDAEGFLSITGRKKYLFKTSGGKYVSPEKLENLFQGHPYVSQVVVIGNRRRFVSALLVPNFRRLEAYAASQGIAFRDRQELADNPQIHAFLQREVDQLVHWLPPHERIRQIAILPQEFTMDAGEVSATHKIKRPVVEDHYRDLIEEVYRRQPDKLEVRA
jgi:long-chain acyl-CoA synthetase